MFSSYGIPEQLVSDNGPQFLSGEFGQFMKQNGMKHIKCATYHPSSNGQAEHFVPTFKEAIRAGVHDRMSLQRNLENFLLVYRTTPHASTGVPPCMLFLGRNLKTRLDLLGPNMKTTVLAKQANQKKAHDDKV